MKRINLIEAVTDFFASDQAGEQKQILHPEIVKVHFGNVYGRLLYDLWLNAKRFSDYSQMDALCKTYEVDLLGESNRKAYAILPFAPVQLPDGAGIRQVCDHDDNSNVLAPIDSTANVVFQELDVDTMDDTHTYRVEMNNLSTGAGEASHKLVIERLPITAGSIESLDVLMVVPFSEYDDYDDIAIPAEQGDLLVRQVIELLSGKKKPDTTTDSVIE